MYKLWSIHTKAYNSEVSNELRPHTTAWRTFKRAATGLPSLTTMDVRGQTHPSCGGTLRIQGPVGCAAAPLASPCHMPLEAPPWPLKLCPTMSSKASGLCQLCPVEQTPPPPSHWGKEDRLKRFVQRCESLGKTPGAHKGSVVFRGRCWGETDHKKQGRISRKCPKSRLCGWSHDYIKICQSSQSCTQTQQIITK